MHRRTAATRLVTLITLGALAATLVGTVTVQARESRSTDRQLRIKADPARETAGLRTFRKVDVANLPAATGKGSGYDPVLKRPDVNRSPAAPQGAPSRVASTGDVNGDPAITQATAIPGLAFASKGRPPASRRIRGWPQVRSTSSRRSTGRPHQRSLGQHASTVDMFDFFGLDGSTTRATSSSSIRASSTTAFMLDGSRSRRASTASQRRA